MGSSSILRALMSYSHPSRHSPHPHHAVSRTHHVIPAPITSYPASSSRRIPHPSRHSQHPHHVIPRTPITSYSHPSRHTRTHHAVSRTPITSFPSPITPYPAPPITPYPAPPITSFPAPITSFPRRRESCSLRPTTYPWAHPGPRKVTGCIRRMVRGECVQIPAYAGMT